MIADIEKKITIQMSVDEARAIGFCLAKCLSDSTIGPTYIDVLPDNAQTKEALEGFCASVRKFI